MSRPKDYRLSMDTTPESEQLLFELLAKKSPAQKLRMMSQMSATVRALAMSGLRERYPYETESQLKVRLAESLYGSEVAARVASRLKNSQSNE